MSPHFANTMKNVKAIVIVTVSQIAIYLIQYIIIPAIYFPHPQDQTINMLIIIITSIVISGTFMWFSSEKYRYWLMTIPIYFVAVHLYHPEYLFGIGYDGYLISLIDTIGIAIWTIVVSISELIALGLIKLIRHLILKFHYIA